jgi:hypothetical protein
MSGKGTITCRFLKPSFIASSNFAVDPARTTFLKKLVVVKQYYAKGY